MIKACWREPMWDRKLVTENNLQCPVLSFCLPRSSISLQVSITASMMHDQIPSIKPSFKCQTLIPNNTTQMYVILNFSNLFCMYFFLFLPYFVLTRFQMRKLKLKKLQWLGIELRSFEPSVPFISFNSVLHYF